MKSELIEGSKNIDNEVFWDYIEKGEFRLQKCKECNSFRNPISEICPNCSSNHFSWEPISGQGEVFTWTKVHKVYHPAFKDEVPYNIVIVKLDEGVHFLSNVECGEQELRIGMRVKAKLMDLDSPYKIPRFVPIGG